MIGREMNARVRRFALSIATVAVLAGITSTQAQAATLGSSPTLSRSASAPTTVFSGSTYMGVTGNLYYKLNLSIRKNTAASVMTAVSCNVLVVGPNNWGAQYPYSGTTRLSWVMSPARFAVYTRGGQTYRYAVTCYQYAGTSVSVRALAGSTFTWSRS